MVLADSRFEALESPQTHAALPVDFDPSFVLSTVLRASYGLTARSGSWRSTARPSGSSRAVAVVGVVREGGLDWLESRTWTWCSSCAVHLTSFLLILLIRVSGRHLFTPNRCQGDTYSEGQVSAKNLSTFSGEFRCHPETYPRGYETPRPTRSRTGAG